MRIAILTYYGVHNHGALLQAYGLKKTIEDYGHDVQLLRYDRNYDCCPEGTKEKYSISLSSVSVYLRFLKERGLRSVIYNYKKKRILDSFRSAELNIGLRYHDFDGDIIVIGSDEVFSSEIGINPFFYGHGLKNKKTVSYAGSFGPTTMDDLKAHGLCELVSSGLEKLSSVSVRDCNSKYIVEELLQKEVEMHCDPVFMYGFLQEQLMFSPKEDGYLLIYSYDKNLNEEKEVNRIREFASLVGLKIFSVGYYHKWCEKNINCSPLELLGWIRNASFVVTDTFHGSVLSILCNKDFAVKERMNRNKITSLLQEYGLQNRLLHDFEELNEIASSKIDYSAVNRVLEMKRYEAKQYLINAIGEQ